MEFLKEAKSLRIEVFDCSAIWTLRSRSGVQKVRVITDKPSQMTRIAYAIYGIW